MLYSYNFKIFFILINNSLIVVVYVEVMASGATLVLLTHCFIKFLVIYDAIYILLAKNHRPKISGFETGVA